MAEFSREELDEDRSWTLRGTCFAALAAGMIVFILPDFSTKLIGPP